MSPPDSDAFAHPEARAAATPPDARPLDRISLRDHVRAIEVGAFQSERGVPQRVRFDVVVEVRGVPGTADDVDRILSYDEITAAIDAALAAGRADLLETLAERIAAGILAHPLAARAFVRIQKLDRGPGALGVEIVRAAPEAGARPAAVPVPEIVVMASDAAALGPRLDALGGPALIVAAPAGPPEAPTGDAAADRRLALLRLDAAAWRLAARDARLAVRASRTEIDWGLREGGPGVWAPAKMVLDAAQPPADLSAEALAAWIARGLGA